MELVSGNEIIIEKTNEKTNEINSEDNDIEKVAVLNVYNNIAKHFDNTRHYQWPWITKFILDIPKKSLIYDIGSGNGRNMLYYDYTFKGIDNCPEFVKICQDKKLDVELADMAHLPFPSETSDYSISIASFHHLATVERRIACLKEMNRVLRKGGKLLLSVWSLVQPEKTKRSFQNFGGNYVPWKPQVKNNENRLKTQFRYYYIFKLDEIRKLFMDTGFKEIKYEWDCGNEIFILEKN